ncbi:MAG: methylmalonyl-CoA mutase [Deltaproteobacteria bacterium]|nr:methylmalonyl-CoA mutase [Deltaproteobacteria bacterium]
MAQDSAGRPKKYETMSGLPLKAQYGPDDLPPFEEVGAAGEYPFTRGIHPTMYRGRAWTMRMFAGFGTPEETNRRFHYLLEQGQTGLSTAFDMPTLMGYDPDDPRSLGEVGREGVSVASVEDMLRLFAGIPLDRVSTSMTINAPAIVVLALYVAAAESQGVAPEALRGTTQTDILKEFIAQKEWICPVRPSMRLVRDMLVWCTKHAPQWNTISISGYHIREAGATAVQELAFTLADGLAYVALGQQAGLDVDTFGKRLSFFFDVHNDFFEEVAKFRAARRMWARFMKERFGAKDSRTWLLRTHAQTAGVSLTAQQPYNNIVRTTLQALAAVLGGTQSLHTNSFDETYALPTEEAATIALRTQQIVADESGVAQVVDPLGGSYFVEALTTKVEEAAMEYIRRIDELGGMTRAVEQGYPQREISRSAYEDQRKVEEQQRIIVGLNRYRTDGGKDVIPTLKIELEGEQRQRERIRELRGRRDAARVRRLLDDVRSACREEAACTFYPILEAVRAHATVGEICRIFREEFGEHTDPAYL